MIALKGGIPDFVPHFEIDFQETERDFGTMFYGLDDEPSRDGLSPLQINLHNARLRAAIARKFDHSIIVSTFTPHCPGRTFVEESVEQISMLRDLVGSDLMVLGGGDPTFAIPGSDMMEFVMRIYDDPAGLHEEAKRNVETCMAAFERYSIAGADGFLLWSDYAFNSGTFLSPEQFEEFIQPYLAEIIKFCRDMDAVVIKHTDGNIMPVLDAILKCRPHALHSLDPMAGMEIADLKRDYGNQVCLIGNVHCAHMQSGTREQIAESALHAMTCGKPGGGYIFSTSNVVFRGMPLDSYDLIHDIWMQHRNYN